MPVGFDCGDGASDATMCCGGLHGCVTGGDLIACCDSSLGFGPRPLYSRRNGRLLFFRSSFLVVNSPFNSIYIFISIIYIGIEIYNIFKMCFNYFIVLLKDTKNLFFVQIRLVIVK